MIVDASAARPAQTYPVRWYRSTWYNITIIGLCNFAAPGIWGAMNSLGAGGAAKPYLINAANALTFGLMVVSCFFSSVLVKYVGIKGALIFGTLGYAPYAAGLYTNNRFGTDWFVLVGAALCGISAGVFWMAEAAIAIGYPEPWNKGRALGWWLSFRGQLVGGAINLGINARRAEAGQVSYSVYLVFIAIQAAGPLVALLLNKPEHVERQDGKKVELRITNASKWELKETVRLFLTKRFLLVLLFIGQGCYSESVYYTYISLYFSVRARALGSFLGAIVAIIAGNVLGAWLDATQISLRRRARWAFFLIVTTQAGWWTWLTVLSTRYHHQTPRPEFDWGSEGFGAAFAVYLAMTLGFQLNYIFLYFMMHNLARDEAEVIRYSALLRGSESAWQAVSYGLSSVESFAATGQVYLNFGLYVLSVFPAWMVVRHFGEEREQQQEQEEETDTSNGKELVQKVVAV